MTKTLYLPGAVGSAEFWRPVAQMIAGDHELLSWPGLGAEPAQSHINSLDDLVTSVLKECEEPVNLVAQSMGGLVAIKIALRQPEKVEKLVLTVTSAGVNVADLGASDWRQEYFEAFPNAARWIEEPTADLSDCLHQISCPTLLIWGDADPISPVAVGERLAELIPNAQLQVIKGGDHDLAKLHSQQVANLIRSHLS